MLRVVGGESYLLKGLQKVPSGCCHDMSACRKGRDKGGCSLPHDTGISHTPFSNSWLHPCSPHVYQQPFTQGMLNTLHCNPACTITTKHDRAIQQPTSENQPVHAHFVGWAQNREQSSILPLRGCTAWLLQG